MIHEQPTLQMLLESFVKISATDAYDHAGPASDWGRYRYPMLDMILNDCPEAFTQLNNWRLKMARRTFTIELKIDLDNEDERYEPMKKIVMRYARDLMANSTLLAGGNKPPEVVAFTEDAFFTTEELKIDVEEGSEEVTSEVTEDEV